MRHWQWKIRPRRHKRHCLKETISVQLCYKSNLKQPSASQAIYVYVYIYIYISIYLRLTGGYSLETKIIWQHLTMGHNADE